MMSLNFVESVMFCQKCARVTYRDCVPIQGGVVSMEPVFLHFYVDCPGLIFLYKAAYNYAIVFFV